MWMNVNIAQGPKMCGLTVVYLLSWDILCLPNFSVVFDLIWFAYVLSSNPLLFLNSTCHKPSQHWHNYGRLDFDRLKLVRAVKIEPVKSSKNLWEKKTVDTYSNNLAQKRTILTYSINFAKKKDYSPTLIIAVNVIFTFCTFHFLPFNNKINYSLCANK